MTLWKAFGLGLVLNLLYLSSHLLPPRGGPQLQLPAELKLGVVDAYGSSVHEVKLHNAGSRTLALGPVRTSCRCLQVQSQPVRLAAGQTDSLTLRYQAAAPGSIRQTVWLDSNDPRGTRQLPVTGRVPPPVFLDPPLVNFGSVKPNQVVLRTVLLNSKDPQFYPRSRPLVYPALRLAPISEVKPRTYKLDIFAQPKSAGQTLEATLLIDTGLTKTPYVTLETTGQVVP